MDRGAWLATVHGVTESDMANTSSPHVCTCAHTHSTKNMHVCRLSHFSVNPMGCSPPDSSMGSPKNNNMVKPVFQSHIIRFLSFPVSL